MSGPERVLNIPAHLTLNVFLVLPVHDGEVLIDGFLYFACELLRFLVNFPGQLPAREESIDCESRLA